MLVPGRATSSFTALIADIAPGSRYEPFISLQALSHLHDAHESPSHHNNLASLGPTTQSHSADGQPEPRSTDRDDLRSSSSRPSKDGKPTQSRKWWRILTHTFRIQPLFSTKAESDYPEDRAPDFSQMLPCPIYLEGSRMLILDDGRILGNVQTGRSDLRQAIKMKLSRDQKDWLDIAQDLQENDLARLDCQLRFKDTASGERARLDTKLASFHFELDIEVYLRSSLLRDDQRVSRFDLAPLLHYAFIEAQPYRQHLGEAEGRASKGYRGTDIEWFYASLQRPPQHENFMRHGPPVYDRKGKGRELDIDHQQSEYDKDAGIIEAPGLLPTLLPFQSRSVHWMLGREGKTILGKNEDGEDRVGDLQNDDLRNGLARGSFWEQIQFDEGGRLWLNTLTLELSSEDPADPNLARFEGSIAAEEMGLGKTVEVLSLICLNVDSERRKLPEYFDENSGSTVQPSGQTLLICPQAIVSQWQDEIERHAPSLRVLRYEGVKKTFPKDMGIRKIVKGYDIVLCTFDVLRKEIGIARKPVIHGTRSQANKEEKDKVSYRRSLLVSVDWLRVVIDEAQMAASTTSAISETASYIPRRYSWAVSGTPIKQTIDDLAGLLKFLRIRDVADNRTLFQRLLHPTYAAVFTRLISQIGIRTTKAEIAHELTIPGQQRFIVPAAFSAIEKFNYRNRYNDALADLAMVFEDQALQPDWALDTQKMTRWLHLLRQACFHAQAGAPKPRLHTAHTKMTVNNVAQTLEEVLFSLRDKNIAELHVEQRACANARIQRAYRLMYDKEECERFEDALKLLKSAKRDLHAIAEDIHNEMLLILPEAARDSPSTSRSTSAAPGHSYLDAFRDTFKDLVENAKEGGDDKAADKGRLVGVLSNRLRDTVLVMHAAVFFMGNAYFAMSDREEEETAMYAEADVLRKQVLRGDEGQAMQVVRRLQAQIKAKKIRLTDVHIEYTEEEPGLRSAGIFETIDDLTDQANRIGELMMEWRQFIVDGLTAKLSDEEITAEEYQNKAETQEKLDIYIEYLGRIYADWVQIVTGNRSTLADAPSVGGAANITEEAKNAEPTTARVSKRSLYKQKAGMSSAQATAIIAAADPAARLRVELESQRKKVVPTKIDNCLRSQLREFQHLKDRVVQEEEEAIIELESRRLRKILTEKNKLIEQMQAEQISFANVYNARVTFFRLLQEFSDAVAELPSSESTPYALRISMAELKTKESNLERTIVQKIARRRFLESLRSKNQEEEVCLICSDLEGGQVVLTHCGHLYHETCLRQWNVKSHSHTCPVCRASLRRENAWQRIALNKSGEPVPKKEHDDSMNVDKPSEAESSTAKKKAQEDAERALEDLQQDSDPASQLNYLAPDDVEAIRDVQLQGAPLGSKLDMVIKHVVYLRDKHASAIELADKHAYSATQMSSRKILQNGNGFSHSSVPSSRPTEAKILIYSGWQYACEVLANAFARESIGYVRLESTSVGNAAKRKETAVIEFKENPDVTVFILHAQSQAAGLNLTSAQYVILVEPLLQVALEVQAIARVHRIGQRQATTVYQYVIPETVDERIALLSLHRKGHRLFSRQPLAKSLHAPAVPLASPGRNKEGHFLSHLPYVSMQVPRKRKFSQVEDAAVGHNELEDEDDLSRVLFEKTEFLQLQKIMLERAKLDLAKRRRL